MIKTLIIYITNNRLTKQMLSQEHQINDYYGYNSTIDVKGKRIRRLRRTEVSAEKLYKSRFNQQAQSRSISSRRSRDKDSHFQSKMPGSFQDSGVRSSAFKHIGTVRPGTSLKTKKICLNSLKSAQKYRPKLLHQSQASITDVKTAMGQYYVGNNPKQLSKNKIRAKNREDDVKSPRIGRSPNENLQTNGEYFNPHNSSKFSIKRTQKSFKRIRSFDQCEVQQQKQKNIKGKFIERNPKQITILQKRPLNLASSIKAQNSRQKQFERQKFSSIISANSSQNSSKLIENRYSQTNSEIQSIIKSPQIKSKISKARNDSEIIIDMPSNISACQTQKSKTSKLQSKHRERSNNRSEIQQSYAEIQQQKKLVNNLKKVAIQTKITKRQTEATQSQQNSYEQQKMLSQDNINITPKSSKIQKQQSIEQKSSISEHSKSNPENNSTNKLQSNNGIMVKPFQYGQISSKKEKADRQSIKVIKKKSLNQYTFNDVVQNIQEHQIRLGSFYLFIDNTKAMYESPIQFERYEKLCFLILKKYLYEKRRTIRSLQAECNCFTLTDAQIPNEVLKKHINRHEVRQRLTASIQQQKQLTNEFECYYQKLKGKYPKDKSITNKMLKDTFSRQMMKLLMEQLTKLYQQLQGDDIQNDIVDMNEQRIIEIVELMFLASQLNGRKVKKFQLLDQNIVDFQTYYGDNYERIMQTAEYFEKQG